MSLSLSEQAAVLALLSKPVVPPRSGGGGKRGPRAQYAGKPTQISLRREKQRRLAEAQAGLRPAVKVALSTDSFQAYQTPQAIFSAVSADLGPFDLDAAAGKDNALCGKFLDENFNALSVKPWDAVLAADDHAHFGGLYVWLNPPYKAILPWVERAEKAVSQGEASRVVLLLPAQVGSAWWVRCAVNHEIQTFSGRIAFDLPAGMKNTRSPAMGNCLVIIEKNGLKGLTAIRSAKTGVMLHDLTDATALGNV